MRGILMWIAACTLSGIVFAARGQSSSAPMYEAAPVVVWNREIVVYRAPYEQMSPAARAAASVERLLALPAEGPWDIQAQPSSLGAYTGVLITVNGQITMGILEQDVLPNSGETAMGVARQACDRLRDFLEARAEQGSVSGLVKGTAKALAATLALVCFLAGLVWTRRRIQSRIRRSQPRAGKRIQVRDVDLAPMVRSMEEGAVHLASWAIGLSVIYVWLGYVLAIFPFTRPWGRSLGGFLVGTVQQIASAIVHSVPNLLMVVLILVIARFMSRLIGSFFLNVERGSLQSAWLRPDIARATRRIVSALVWAFALTVAYPYIPGSNSAAFKGVSVFLGLMMSLGSAGMINQVISGLVVVYSQAFETGDLVRIGETEGVVVSVGLLSTRIRTHKQEEVTVPNALMVSTPAWNFSAFGGGKGAFVSSTVTIGYDAPWRQVHALLLQAAAATAGVRKEPEPFVIQKSLSDFYVEYHLVVQLENPVKRVPVLSELHGHIQDAFNEHGVQIMSPHFKSQPADKVWVPKEKWHVPPAPADKEGGLS